ncbi:glycosyl transferase group 1 [Opitutus terrae PB90-1]|uniref:Glycosyl transferase group 1 n=1 Tax=Opitutus terrae (strain DSM 11246 / JCM 15787 / PB90-1) TaxID=452637 RepID=B1ZQA0_OPITP|nr:glycosyl transferase group 1 [Opitutus terrae PB90-1]
MLHCVSHLALGGAERIALTIITALRAEIDFGLYAVRGLGDGTVGESLRDEVAQLGIPLYLGAPVPMRFGGMITGAVGLAAAARRFAPEVIHLHTEIPEASYAALAAVRPSLARVPLVRTIHNSVYWEFWRPLGRWSDRRMSRSLCAAVSADALKAVRRLRAESGAAPFSAEPLVIYSAVAPGPAKTVQAALASDELRIIFGGRFEPEKGADLLPQILREAIVPAGRRCRLWIFGSGTHAPQLRALAAASPAGWAVEVHPPVADFRARLVEADIAIVPSRFEGLGLVAIEAALAGVPLVVTDAPGLREAVPPEHPWRASPGDPGGFATALSDALAHPERWPAAVRAAQRFAAERFSMAAMRDSYRALYRQSLEQPRTS